MKILIIVLVKVGQERILTGKLYTPDLKKEGDVTRIFVVSESMELLGYFS
jgi:hypothetical protein